MANIHTAILPNGTQAKRTSTSRVYTHLVAIELQNGRVDYADPAFPFIKAEGTTWTVHGWNGSLALAMQSAAGIKRSARCLDVKVLACQVATKTPADKVVVRANGRGGCSVRAAGRDLGKVWNLPAGLTAAVYNQVAGTNPDLVVPNVASGVAYILGSHGRPQAEIDQVLAKLEGGGR